MPRKANNFGTFRNTHVFKCEVCGRNTRDTGQGVDHLCEDCYELTGIDNSINDNGYLPGSPDFEHYLPSIMRHLAHIAKLGGNVAEVIRCNDFCFPRTAGKFVIATKAGDVFAGALYGFKAAGYNDPAVFDSYAEAVQHAIEHKIVKSPEALTVKAVES